MRLKPAFKEAADIIKAAKDADRNVFFVLRHGQSTGQLNINDYKRLGDRNILLTPRGIEQSIAAAQLLSPLFKAAGLTELDVVSSTGNRATRTAQEILKTLNALGHEAGVRFSMKLDKQKFGRFGGLFTDEERKAKHPEDYAAYLKELERVGPFHVKMPGAGESLAMVQKRGKVFLTHEIKATPIIVTHGTNALCLENVLMNHGEQWVLDNIDTWKNCSVRMFTGDRKNGYTAQTLIENPLTGRHKTATPAGSPTPALTAAP